MSLIINTLKNVWDMEKGFDIILFIDETDVVNIEFLKDKICFRRINAKSTFHELFMTRIVVKFGKRSAFLYSVYGESICCLLLNGSRKTGCGKAKNSGVKEGNERSKVTDFETGLQMIRNRLTGYRYLAVQRRARPVAYYFELIFRTVFHEDSGELWLCGQRSHLPSPCHRTHCIGNGLSHKHGARHIKVLTKNNSIGSIPSTKKLLPVAKCTQKSVPLVKAAVELLQSEKYCEKSTKLTPKSASAVPSTKAAIELLQSDDDCEKLISAEDTQHPNHPMIEIIPQNIWELNTDVDIILFMDIEIIYKINWKNKAVERVNELYPFKDRLLEDIQVMPLAPGNVRMYRGNGVSIFCIFFCNRKAILDNWVEDALISIKRRLAGHVQLAIQQDLSLSVFQAGVNNNLYYFFKLVFAFDTVKLWICGGSSSGD